MEIKDSQDGDFAFGEFRLSPASRTLWRSGERVPLTPKAIEVLAVLVRNAGEVVTREELIRAVWPDTYVDESNLNQTVFMLRKALGRGASETLIVTVQGKGYRFTAPVRLVPDRGTRGQERAPESTAAPALTRRLLTRRGFAWGILAAAAITALLTASLLSTSRRSEGPVVRATDRRVMLAVLPFDNLTGDASQEYFSDGMTEEMISQLGYLDPTDLGVIGRTSVMRYKGTRTPLDRIGRELGVQYLLEGSLRRESSQVRVAAQLIRAEDQTHLWAREYDRELRNLLALQRDIAHDIAIEIQLSLDEERPRSTDWPGMTPKELEAHDAYLKGRFFWNQRTPEGFDEALKYFNMAITADPGHARAHAGLADCYTLLPGYKGEPQAKYVEKARAAALRALELDERLAEARTSLALIIENHDWDWPAAEREYRRAIELNPNYATAHHWYAELLAWQGRFEEALIESERARRLDPHSLIIAADNGMILYFSRQFDRAAKKLEAVIELEPSFPRGHAVRHVYVKLGRFDEAIDDIRVFSPHSTPADLVYALGRAGRKAEAATALAELKRLNDRQLVDPALMAWAYVGIGDNEQALAWLERAVAQRSSIIVNLKVEPGWDPLRSDPRFQALLHAVHLAD